TTCAAVATRRRQQGPSTHPCCAPSPRTSRPDMAAAATKTRKAKDPILEAAADVARAAAQETAEAAEHVGEHLGTTVDEDRLVSHRFAAAMPGYRGWHWTVTLARVPRGRVATVCEVELLPGDDAILAPEWLPWSDRL